LRRRLTSPGIAAPIRARAPSKPADFVTRDLASQLQQPWLVPARSLLASRIPLVAAATLLCCRAPTSSRDGRDAAVPNTVDAGVADPSCSCTNGLVLRGGSVVDPAARTIVTRDVFICAGIIVDALAEPSCAPTELDVAGKWLIPSLSDMHVHARGISLGDQSFRNMTVDAEAAIFRLAGVTSFLDAMNDEAKIFPIRDAQRALAQYPGADIFTSGGAFTPTGGHGTEYGLPATSYRIVDTAAQANQQIDDIAKKRPDIIKIFYDHRGFDGGPDVKDGQRGELGIAMKKEVMVALVAAANARHLKTEVHIGVWSDARDAIAAGATAIAHLGEPAVPDDIVSLARDHGVYWIPTLSLYHGVTDLAADQSLLDDPLLKRVAAADVIDSYRANKLSIDVYEKAWLARHAQDASNVLKLLRGGVTLLAGTDVVEHGMFIGWSLHRELKLLVQAGLSPFDALAAATTRAGELLGRNYGIAPGAEANILVLDASPIDDIWNTTRIDKIIHHGSLVALP
jgi:imidazolonepropionase-like amidohydrolase